MHPDQLAFFKDALQMANRSSRAEAVISHSEAAAKQLNTRVPTTNSPNLNDPNYLYLHPSRHHGTGLFTSKSLPKGTIIPFTSSTSAKLSYINDGANFPFTTVMLAGCHTSPSQPIPQTFESLIAKYYATSKERINVRPIYPADDEKIAIPVAVEVIKDIPAGAELLRTYGSAWWLMMLDYWADGWLSRNELGVYMRRHMDRIVEMDERGWELACLRIHFIERQLYRMSS